MNDNHYIYLGTTPLKATIGCSTTPSKQTRSYSHQYVSCRLKYLLIIYKVDLYYIEHAYTSQFIHQVPKSLNLSSNSMRLLSDFPPEVIDQIVGATDTSYVVVHLWKCGDRTLNSRLSKGVTLIDLKCHPLANCTVPRMISEFRSLRHLRLYSYGSMVKKERHWRTIFRSWPSTLEYLAIESYQDFVILFYNPSSNPFKPISTTYARGKSCAIELETLFPRLHTLKLASSGSIEAGHIFPDIFPALPASLTRLEAPIRLAHDNLTTSYLSLLPPGILHLTGPIEWTVYTGLSSEEGIEAMRFDCAHAPSGLQSFPAERLQAWTTEKERENASYDCWLPKSLLEIDWMDSECCTHHASKSPHTWAWQLQSCLFCQYSHELDRRSPKNADHIDALGSIKFQSISSHLATSCPLLLPS